MIAPLFVSTNKNKIAEFKHYFPDLENEGFDLPEIQEMDQRLITTEKADFFLKQTGKVNFFVEDTALYCQGMNGLPGPFIKWFLKQYTREELAKTILANGNPRAYAQCVIGYVDSVKKLHLFEGRIEGQIVFPRKDGFGWDPIFQPEGTEKTFSEMSFEEKVQRSHRAFAARDLVKFLASR